MGETNPTRYVVGFAFNTMRTDVVLIEKKRPAWQLGKLNGVGGHVEANESLTAAMSREFWEETNVKIPEADWQYFAALTGKDWHVSCFKAFTGQVYNVQSSTDEVVKIMNVRSAIETERKIRNLSYLIPLALDDDSAAPPVFHYVSH